VQLVLASLSSVYIAIQSLGKIFTANNTNLAPFIKDSSTRFRSYFVSGFRGSILQDEEFLMTLSESKIYYRIAMIFSATAPISKMSVSEFQQSQKKTYSRDSLFLFHNQLIFPLRSLRRHQLSSHLFCNHSLMSNNSLTNSSRIFTKNLVFHSDIVCSL